MKARKPTTTGPGDDEVRKQYAIAAVCQVRRITKSSFPRHAPSSRGCAGGEVLHQALPSFVMDWIQSSSRHQLEHAEITR